MRPIAALVCLLALSLTSVGCPRYMRLPPPPALPDTVQQAIAPGDAERLSKVRIQLPPADQQLLERSLEQLAADPRIPRDETRAAVSRALDGAGSPDGFCDRLVHELASFQLQGELADAPSELAVAIAISDAYTRFLTAAGRARYPDPVALSRAARDGLLQPDDFGPDVFLVAGDRPTFATDAALFERPTPGSGGAGAKLCLSGPPSDSYLIAYVATSRLAAPPRVPTAADGVCRPRFTPAPPGARSGQTCTGNPEYATPALRVGDAARFGLSR